MYVHDAEAKDYVTEGGKNLGCTSYIDLKAEGYKPIKKQAFRVASLKSGTYNAMTGLKSFARRCLKSSGHVKCKKAEVVFRPFAQEIFDALRAESKISPKFKDSLHAFEKIYFKK